MPPSPHRRALVPTLVGLTLVVSIISSLGAPLIPDVADSLGVPISSAQWSLTSALLAGAIAAPIVGRLGDGPWRRETMIVVLVVVTVGGLIAGLAETLPLLIVGRSMQGIGLGLAPIAMAAARDHLPPERGTAAIGLLSVSGAAGVGLGYPISGLIAAQFDVRVAFFFGAAFSGLALLLALPFIPSSRGSSAMPLDVRSAAVGGVGVVALLLGVGQGEQWGWGSPAVLGCFAAAVAVLGLWAHMQLNRPAPLVDLRQLRHRAVLGADLAAVLLGVSLYMFLTLVTEFVQTPAAEGFGFDASTLTAGLCLVPFSICSLAASRVMSSATRRLGTRALLVFGTLVIAVAGSFFALVHSALWQAFATMALVGIGFGFTFAVIPGLIARSVPHREVGSAMGFYQVIRSIGFSVGSALVASVLAAHEPQGGGFPTQQGYSTALWIGAGICLLAALTAALLSPPNEGMVEAEIDEYARGDAELASAGLPDRTPPKPSRQAGR